MGRIRRLIAFGSGMFSLPPLIFAVYLLLCWIRIQTADVYYVDYPYLPAALGFLFIAAISVLLTMLNFHRKLFGLGFLGSIFLGLVTMVYIPDGNPHVQRSMVRDSNYLSAVNSFL